MDWFWIGSGQEFALKPSSKDFFARGKKQKQFLRVLGRILSGTTGLVSVIVGHYWIGLGEGRIGFGLVSGGPAGGTTGLDTLWVKRNWFRCTIGLDTLSGKQPWRNHSSDNRYRGACIKACGSLWLSLSPKRSPKVQATHMKFSSVSRLWICILPMMFRGYRILLV